MKKRKGNLLQRMMAVFLSAVLVAGTVAGAVPTEVFAAENMELSGTISENTAGMAEEETSAEPVGETVSGNDAFDFDSGIENITDVYASWTQNAAQNPEVCYSTDGGSTWTDADQLIDLLYDPVTSADNLQIKLLRDITLVAGEGNNWADAQQPLGRAGKKWTIDGDGHTITRGEGCKALFYTAANGTVIMKDITIDGGAVWSSDDLATRQNSGIMLNANAHLIYVQNDATMILESGVTLQNSDLGAISDDGTIVSNNDGAAVMVEKGTLVIKDGVEIMNNRARYGGAIYVTGTAKLTMEGGKIYGNQGTGYGGGVFNFSGTVEIKGGKINNNRTATSVGGGVMIYGGSMELTGSPVIEGNTDKNGAANNVYLNRGKIISISGSLTESAKIGVTTNVKPAADAPVAVTGENGADYSIYFFSDAKKYGVGNTADNVIQLAVKTEITPVLSLPESMTIHPKSNTAGDIMSEVVKNLEISGVDGLEKENDYTIVQSYEAGTGKYIASFRLTEAVNEKYFVGTGSVTEVECMVQLHSFGDWRETKPATASEDGSKERSCACGYKETEVIPKTGGETPDPGKIETDKEQGENTPDADFGTSKDDLISAVLKQEERDLVAAGTDIKIVLDIDNIDASVEPSDKQAVTDKAGEYTVGQYLDISLYKIINDNYTDKEKISQTTGKIRIVLTIPYSLKNTDSGKTRSYAVVRVHDGAAELLSDIDNDEETITIETDLFSTYALVYKDMANTGDQNPDDGGNSDSGNSGDDTDSDGNEDNSSDNGSDSDTDNDNHTADAKKDNEPKTGDTTPIEIYATLAMVAGLSYLILLFGNRKMGMTEQEKKELTAALVAWGRKGGKLRRAAALAVIFLILVYYHSIGKKICVEWKEVYGE